VTGWLLSKSILQSLSWWQAGKNLDPVTHRFVSIERVCVKWKSKQTSSTFYIRRETRHISTHSC
jgi:hypothetical protein